MPVAHGRDFYMGKFRLEIKKAKEKIMPRTSAQNLHLHKADSSVPLGLKVSPAQALLVLSDSSYVNSTIVTYSKNIDVHTSLLIRCLNFNYILFINL